MFKFIFTAVIAMTFGTLVIAQSTIPLERELHVVSHYEGRDKTNGQPHGPISDIEIDRPNKPVTLVLGAHSPIRWTVSVSDATQIEKVVLFGRSARKSEILLTGGNLDTYSILPDIQYISREKSQAVREFVAHVPSELGFTELTTLQASYRPKTTTIVGQNLPHLQPWVQSVYLDRLVMPKTNLPVPFREILTNATQDPHRWSNLPTRKKQSDQGYRFDGNGFTFTHPETAKVTQFPVSLDVPRISWSSGVAYDPSNNMLYGVSLGGEGFLYSYDIDGNKWTVLASMDGHDAHGLLFEPEKNRWVMAGVWKNLTTPMIATYDVKHGLRVTQIPLDALSGVTDIYDRGNGPGPDLRPMAIDGNKVLAIATPPEHFRGRGDVKWRAYQIDVTNGNVALVGYHGD